MVRDEWPEAAEVQYVNNGFPYTASQGFMDLFEGLSYAQVDFVHAGTSHTQGVPGPSTSQYYHGCTYGPSEYVMRNDEGPRSWGNYSVASYDQPLALALHANGSSELTSINGLSHFEECILDNRHHASVQDVFWPNNRVQHIASNAQVIAEDNVNPDNMTYEELLDLGESVGTHGRGLPPEMISSLPISKYKCGFFSRRRSRERCVICQMNYRRGDMRMTLPCRHIYHASCVSRWLRINKACPVCFVEVSGVERKR